MGSRRNPKHYKLKFDEDTEYPGLEMTLRAPSIGELRGASTTSEDGDDEGAYGTAKMIAKYLVDWNREDEDGVPLPPTLESLLGEESTFPGMVIAEWTKAIAGVPAPLEQPSDSGETSAVESIPMEALSPSLAS